MGVFHVEGLSLNENGEAKDLSIDLMHESDVHPEPFCVTSNNHCFFYQRTREPAQWIRAQLRDDAGPNENPLVWSQIIFGTKLNRVLHIAPNELQKLIDSEQIERTTSSIAKELRDLQAATSKEHIREQEVQKTIKEQQFEFLFSQIDGVFATRPELPEGQDENAWEDTWQRALGLFFTCHLEYDQGDEKFIMLPKQFKEEITDISRYISIENIQKYTFLGPKDKWPTIGEIHDYLIEVLCKQLKAQPASLPKLPQCFYERRVLERVERRRQDLSPQSQQNLDCLLSLFSLFRSIDPRHRLVIHDNHLKFNLNNLSYLKHLFSQDDKTDEENLMLNQFFTITLARYGENNYEEFSNSYHKFFNDYSRDFSLRHQVLSNIKEQFLKGSYHDPETIKHSKDALLASLTKEELLEGFVNSEDGMSSLPLSLLLNKYHACVWILGVIGKSNALMGRYVERVHANLSLDDKLAFLNELTPDNRAGIFEIFDYEEVFFKTFRKANEIIYDSENGVSVLAHERSNKYKNRAKLFVVLKDATNHANYVKSVRREFESCTKSPAKLIFTLTSIPKEFRLNFLYCSDLGIPGGFSKTIPDLDSLKTVTMCLETHEQLVFITKYNHLRKLIEKGLQSRTPDLSFFPEPERIGRFLKDQTLNTLTRLLRLMDEAYDRPADQPLIAFNESDIHFMRRDRVFYRSLYARIQEMEQHEQLGDLSHTAALVKQQLPEERLEYILSNADNVNRLIQELYFFNPSNLLRLLHPELATTDACTALLGYIETVKPYTPEKSRVQYLRSRLFSQQVPIDFSYASYHFRRKLKEIIAVHQPAMRRII